MKKLIPLIIALLIVVQMSAQKNVTAQWGPTYKTKARLSGIVGEDKDGFYTLRSNRKGDMWIERYDTKMTLQFSEELVIPKKGKKRLAYEGIYYLQGQLILLTSHTDKKAGKSYAFAYPISSKGVVGSKFKKLDEVAMNGRRSGGFDFEVSQDSSKFLAYHNKPYDKYNNEKFSYKVFDNKLNLVWEKDLQLPYKDKFFSIKDYILDNDGNVYMRATIYPDRTKGEKKSNKEQTSKFVIVSYKHKTDKLSQFEVKLTGKWVKSISYDVNEDTKEVVVGGFYSDDKKMKINGIFYLAMDLKSGEIKATSKKAFDSSFMTEMIGEKKAEKGKGLSNFDFDYFLTKKDGGAYLIAEQYYITTHTYTDSNGNTNTRTVYHYNDVIVVSVGKTGDIEWVRKVPKNSAASSGYYLSYGLNFNDNTNELNLFFNDNPKNIELLKNNPNKVRRVGSLKKSVAILVSLNEEGNMSRSPMFSAKDLDKIILKPTMSLRTSDTDVITYAVKGKSYKFGRFTFK
jgi:hypothetical protein